MYVILSFLLFTKNVPVCNVTINTHGYHDAPWNHGSQALDGGSGLARRVAGKALFGAFFIFVGKAGRSSNDPRKAERGEAVRARPRQHMFSEKCVHCSIKR